MLALAPLRHTKDEVHGDMGGFSIGTDGDFPDFSVFSDGNLLDSIDFDDLFDGFNNDELPDLDMDLAEFSISTGGGESDINTSASIGILFEDNIRKYDEQEEDKCSGSGSGSSSNPSEEIVSKREKTEVNKMTVKLGHDQKGRKTSSHNGKRKVKVDWTPELHRRFVQAVEQLGVDKAVPSRILEIMGIDCLTRHNIASHLQKYRSHRKHLLAREAEAASWSQRRQIYGAATTGGGKRELNPWLAPIMGFPPPLTPPPPPPQQAHHFRPLHVWGHPSIDQSLVHMWPKHLAHSLSPPPHHTPMPTWAPPLPRHPPSIDPSYWHRHQRRFGAPPVLVTPPPHTMYKVDSGVVVSGTHPPLDLHPSKESIDAAIGDVITKPWLPLPLGLKPPSLDGVLVELQRQGVAKIPPMSCS